MAASKRHGATNIRTYPDSDLDQSLRDNARHIADRAARNAPNAFQPRLSTRSHFTKDPDRSYPVDLNQVSARLFQIVARAKRPDESDEASLSDESSPSPETPSSGASTPPPPDTQRLEQVQKEKKRYAKLIKDGGRPWYPIDLIDDVSKNPQANHDLLEYWQDEIPDSTADSWTIFKAQWTRWKEFRKWQTRTRTDNKETFPDYVEHTKARLQEHDFTDPVELNEDPKQQGILPTWIEYLSYELGRYEKVSWYKTHEDEYEAAWKKLEDSEVLSEDETRDYIESEECTQKRRNEGIRVRQGVEAVRSALLLAERDTLDPSQRGSAVHKRLAMAQDDMEEALRIFDEFKQWNDEIEVFCRATKDYIEARRQAYHHDILLDWVREQIALVRNEVEFEREMGMKAACNDEEHQLATKAHTTELASQPPHEREASHTPNSCTSKRNRTDDGADEQHPKRIKGANQVSATDKKTLSSNDEPATVDGTAH